MDISTTDWIGYLASAIVLWSFYFSDMKKLRLVNLIGAVVFVLYGYLLQAYPIMAFNTGIIILHLKHLFIDKESKHE